MEEGCPIGDTKQTALSQLSLDGGLRSNRESSRPHSEIFTDSMEVGSAGANG